MAATIEASPFFEEKMEWSDDIPLANIVASGPNGDFTKPVDCAGFIRFVINDVMARPTTAFPVAPRVIVIDANVEKRLPDEFLDLFPKADGMVNALSGLLRGHQ